MKSADIIDRIEIFATLSEEDRHSVAGLMKEQSVDNGTVLVKRGDTGHALYYVLSGQLNGSVIDGEGNEKPVANYCQGQCFGDMGLLIGEKSPHTVRAVADARLLVLEKDDFDDFLGQNVPAMLKMMKVIAQRKAESKQQPAVHDEHPVRPNPSMSQPPLESRTSTPSPVPSAYENPPIPGQVPVSNSDDAVVDRGEPDRRQDASVGSMGNLPANARKPKGDPPPPHIEPVLDTASSAANPSVQETERDKPLTYVNEQAAHPAGQPLAANNDHLDVALEDHPIGGKVITIFSPKGGVGKSTVAVNLAVAMARARRGDVALLDLSLTFGHVPLMLNLAPRSSLAAANPDALRRLDLPENMDHYLMLHPSSGLRVMAGALKPEEGELVSAETVGIALQQLRRHFAYLVIDTGSQFTDPVLAALEASDMIFVLCSPEMSVLRDVRECQRIWGNVVRIPRDRVHYLMNNLFPFKTLSRGQLEEGMQQKLFAELPYGGDAAAKAVLKGETLIEARSGSPLARSIQALAAQLTAEGIKGGGKQDRKRGFFR